MRRSKLYSDDQKLTHASFILVGFCGPFDVPAIDWTNALEDLIQEKIDQMSHLQKMNQIRRNSFWTTSDNEVLGIPGFVMSDGPHGVRLWMRLPFRRASRWPLRGTRT